MKVAAMIGALVGGLLGALAWGGIVSVTDMEIGYMATGIGFLVGYGSVLLGGRGLANGLLCAIVALGAIFGGKMFAVRFVAPKAVRAELAKTPEAEGKSPAEIDAAADEVVKAMDFKMMLDITKDTLDPIDILFAGLGVAASFQIGSRGSHRPVATSTGPPMGGPPGVPPPPQVPPASPPEV